MSAYPPFDPVLAAALDLVRDQIPVTITPEMIPAMRAQAASMVPDLSTSGFVVEDATVKSFDGAEISLSVLTPAQRTRNAPGFFFIHGGGMIAGNRHTGVDVAFDWINKFNAVLVSVEYRLAPEHKAPTQVEDCYAGLLWTVENADRLGIDSSRVIVVGNSAGGGLAAGVALLARDRSGPSLLGQMLMYPMLDDRLLTVSSKQIDGVGLGDRGGTVTSWDALLGESRGADDVSSYVAPSREKDLGRLPTAFIDCGSSEVFRDEDVDYASRIWAAGGQAELHVWPGGFHSFETFAPHSALAQDMTHARERWLDRILNYGTEA
jgi:acetyl esterase/lipase